MWLYETASTFSTACLIWYCFRCVCVVVIRLYNFMFGLCCLFVRHGMRQLFPQDALLCCYKHASAEDMFPGAVLYERGSVCCLSGAARSTGRGGRTRRRGSPSLGPWGSWRLPRRTMVWSCVLQYSVVWYSMIDYGVRIVWYYSMIVW